MIHFFKSGLLSRDGSHYSELVGQINPFLTRILLLTRSVQPDQFISKYRAQRSRVLSRTLKHSAFHFPDDRPDRPVLTISVALKLLKYVADYQLLVR